MLRYGFITIFSTLALSFPSAGMAQGLSLEKVEALSEGALPQVREFVTRKLGCSHWEDAQSSAKLKTADAKRAMKHLRCDDLVEDEAFLRKIYAQHLASIKALDAATSLRISVSSSPAQPPLPSGIGF